MEGIPDVVCKEILVSFNELHELNSNIQLYARNANTIMIYMFAIFMISILVGMFAMVFDELKMVYIITNVVFVISYICVGVVFIKMRMARYTTRRIMKKILQQVGSICDIELRN